VCTKYILSNVYKHENHDDETGLFSQLLLISVRLIGPAEMSTAGPTSSVEDLVSDRIPAASQRVRILTQLSKAPGIISKLAGNIA